MPLTLELTADGVVVERTADHLWRWRLSDGLLLSDSAQGKKIFPEVASTGAVDLDGCHLEVPGVRAIARHGELAALVGDGALLVDVPRCTVIAAQPEAKGDAAALGDLLVTSDGHVWRSWSLPDLDPAGPRWGGVQREWERRLDVVFTADGPAISHRGEILRTWEHQRVALPGSAYPAWDGSYVLTTLGRGTYGWDGALVAGRGPMVVPSYVTQAIFDQDPAEIFAALFADWGYRTPEGELRLVHLIDDDVTAHRLSPEAARVRAVEGRGTVVWDPVSGRDLGELLDVRAGLAAASADGRLAVTWAKDSLIAWRAATGERLWEVPLAGVIGLRANEQGITARGRDRTLVIDAASGAVRWEVIAGTRTVTVIADGQRYGEGGRSLTELPAWEGQHLDLPAPAPGEYAVQDRQATLSVLNGKGLGYGDAKGKPCERRALIEALWAPVPEKQAKLRAEFDAQCTGSHTPAPWPAAAVPGVTEDTRRGPRAPVEPGARRQTLRRLPVLTPVWRYETPATVQGLLSDGRGGVLVQAGSSILALDAHGRVRWRVPAQANTLRLLGDGTLLVPELGGALTVRSLDDGAVLARGWRLDPGIIGDHATRDGAPAWARPRPGGGWEILSLRLAEQGRAESIFEDRRSFPEATDEGLWWTALGWSCGRRLTDGATLGCHPAAPTEPRPEREAAWIEAPSADGLALLRTSRRPVGWVRSADGTEAGERLLFARVGGTVLAYALP